MFLNQLKEANKEAFLKLCVYVSNINGDFADEEKNTIYSYCKEMEINKNIPEVDDDDINNILEDINNNATSSEKKIILLEILGLVKCDGNYDSIEKNFINDLVHKLNISKEDAEKINTLLDNYLEILENLVLTISN